MKIIPVSSRRLAKVFCLGLGFTTVSNTEPAKIVTQPSVPQVGSLRWTENLPLVPL